MFPKLSLTALAFAAVALGQQIGTNTAENHPSLPFQKCTKSGGCTTVSSKIVLDANWRWTHNVGGSTNCYTGNTWDATLCPDGTTCATNCALDGADYAGTYGITTSGNALTLKFVTQASQKNVGSRVYLMADDSHYQMFKLPNQEFSFDVDVSNLPCGLNGALYFSEMAADGGVSAFPTNKAGAKYGTGYCDSQCPRDIKFINGVVRFNLLTVKVAALLIKPHRPTPLAGSPLPLMSTAEQAILVPAAMRWMFGKPTPCLLPSLPTLARAMASPVARALLAVRPADTALFVILMVVISTRSAWATRLTTARA